MNLGRTRVSTKNVISKASPNLKQNECRSSAKNDEGCAVSSRRASYEGPCLLCLVLLAIIPGICKRTRHAYHLVPGTSEYRYAMHTWCINISLCFRVQNAWIISMIFFARYLENSRHACHNNVVLKKRRLASPVCSTTLSLYFAPGSPRPLFGPPPPRLIMPM